MLRRDGESLGGQVASAAPVTRLSAATAPNLVRTHKLQQCPHGRLVIKLPAELQLSQALFPCFSDIIVAFFSKQLHSKIASRKD